MKSNQRFLHVSLNPTEAMKQKTLCGLPYYWNKDPETQVHPFHFGKKEEKKQRVVVVKV
jgi:hypothetical protein